MTGFIRQCILVVLILSIGAYARLTVQRPNGEVLEFGSSTVILGGKYLTRSGK